VEVICRHALRLIGVGRMTMATRLSEGDTVAMQGEVTKIHDDDCVTVRLAGYDAPTQHVASI
jgi:translation initiation factor IF-1